MQDEVFMGFALDLARQARDEGEIPVGAVIIGPDGAILGRGYNRTETLANAALHAEIVAINEACAAVGEKYLMGSTIYVSLEPCPMCAAAISMVKIGRVVFGALDPKGGGMWIFSDARAANLFKPEIVGGVMAEESSLLLRDFFKGIRERDGKKAGCA